MLSKLSNAKLMYRKFHNLFKIKKLLGVFFYIILMKSWDNGIKEYLVVKEGKINFLFL